MDIAMAWDRPKATAYKGDLSDTEFMGTKNTLLSERSQIQKALFPV